ncbi:MAG TPA: di-heme oxidoredictase family protein [Thermoanaerobaculia bacterium]|nr:di-heme oxidoredictase family protein [Thermoanaerobaculia bacterium]
MKLRTVPLASLATFLVVFQAFSQVDPGPRGGPPGAGGPLASVAANNPTTILTFFNDAEDRFEEVNSVFGTIPGEPDGGLGPRFNSRSCVACHSQPAVGGTSPAVNPQVADATAHGATNTIPSFITVSGPVREARFKFFVDGAGNPITTAPDGGVHALFTIAGRSDASTCTASVISQPNFANAVTKNNVIFRIPTPLFGTGLMENIDDSTLLAYQASLAGNPLGIAGTFNRAGGAGTISRFGWKASVSSLEAFSGGAYNIEMGVSNELANQERPSPNEDRAAGLPAACRLNATPEDHTNFNTTAVGTPSDVVMFAMFMRLLKPPVKSSTTPGGAMSIINGEALFTEVGCASCHKATFTTAPSSITPDLGNATVRLWSDLQIHRMGTGLADNIQEGAAGGDQFRTAPLWGMGQRLFFLHDGRTSNVLTAISAHSSTGSEANAVVLNFNALTTTQKQDIVNFLRSL